MNFKVFSFILLLVFLLPVGAVAADTDGTTSIGESTEYVSASVETNEEVLGSSKNEEVLGAQDAGTSTMLQEKINNGNNGDIIVLENNYTNTDNFNPQGITISKAITIDGNQYTINNENANEKSLLGISNGEDNLLQSNIIKVIGTNFIDIKNAIDNAEDGDTIDLGGKTYTNYTQLYAYTTDPVKQITIINGTLDAQNYTFADIMKGSRFKNCTLEDITFINFYSTAYRCLWFYDCVLNNVHFNNFDVYQDGIVFSNSIINNSNFTNMRGRINNTSQGNYENSAMIVSNENCKFDNCNFVNLSNNHHSGAICVSGRNLNTIDITNSNFINCSSGIGGALYIHGTNTTSVIYSSIINCSFINCSATEYGGAIGSSQDYLNIENCKFINNTAKRGGAIMVGGITHGLDGNNSQGHNDLLNKCYFYNNTATEEGGAVHITGNNNSAVNCYFDDNFAHGGNGSAIYVHGANASVHDSQFYNHESEKGTVYIEGDYSHLSNNIFKFNNATNGAAIYIQGNNCIVEDSHFENNSAINGGAIYFNGNYATVKNSTFLKNTVTPLKDENTGLGGAIYVKGNYFNTRDNLFDLNVARNGSAIYNDGIHFTLTNDNFVENQAWSYSLITVATPKDSIFNESDIKINVVLVGGDNIINAIYNVQSPMYVTFNNVSYMTKRYGLKTTGMGVSPESGAENSMEGTLLYQDSREDYQLINLTVTDQNGIVYSNASLRTDIYGNVTVTFPKGLAPGIYNVLAEHLEDNLYKEIKNSTLFRINSVDVGVTKTSDYDVYVIGENVIWTIEVTNHGVLNATNVTVNDLLPAGLTYVSSSSTKGSYNKNTGYWNIGTLISGQSVTLNITATTTKHGVINNIATV